MRDGRAKTFIGMGGNFVSATPDTEVTEAALRGCALTVQISTKLNRSHLVHGRTALILPTLGRTDRDIQAGGKQLVSVEDSMSMVHLSRGSLHPPSDQLRSEVAIVCQLARAVLGPEHPVPWERFSDNYDLIRDAIADVVPGCTDYNTRVRQPDGFQLPHPPRDSREFPTTTRKGELLGGAARVGTGAGGPAGAADAAQPRPVQHHHLRPRRPLPRRQGRSPRGVRQSRRHRDDGTVRGGPRRSGVRVPRCRRRPSRSVARKIFWSFRIRPRSAMPRPTTPRPTRWCRWITPRQGPTPRCRKPS